MVALLFLNFFKLLLIISSTQVDFIFIHVFLGKKSSKPKQNRMSLCSPSWPGNYCVAHADLRLTVVLQRQPPKSQYHRRELP